MCARCLKEGMFIPKQKRTKRKDTLESVPSASPSTSGFMDIPESCVVSLITGVGETDNEQTSAITGAPATEKVKAVSTTYLEKSNFPDIPDSYYDSSYDSESYSKTGRTFPTLIILAVTTISVILGVITRRSVQ